MGEHGTITVQHAELGVCHDVPVKDLARSTPALLLAYLQKQGALPPDDPSRPYMVLAEGKTLAPHEGFRRQGVGDGSVLTVFTRGTGAATDDPAATRRALDYQAMAASFPFEGPIVRAWRAYRSLAAALSGRATTAPTQAAVFDVDLRLESLSGPDRYYDDWTVRIDATSSGYPHVQPEAFVVSAVKPWNPHVRGADGWICPGTLWLPTKLVAFYVLDVLRVLNFDFGVDPGQQGGHFAPDAVAFWRNAHGGRPLNDRAYPVVMAPGQQPAADADGFGAIATRPAWDLR